MKATSLGTLEIFSTSPQSKGVPRESYVEQLIQVARWSEESGYQGILVYTDNGLVDPWLTSQIIIENTETLSPLVAVQPIYMHPYTAAKMVATLSHLHQRRIWLNMLAGGFRNDLIALGDTTPHDDRYERTTEYALIIKALLQSPNPVTFEGKYYAVENLKMTPPLPSDLYPGILISGSSEAGRRAAEAIGATAVRYPKPHEEEPGGDEQRGARGIRVGIIAREDGDEAWRIGHERFPQDRKGQLTHQLAMKTSDSSWHEQLSQRAESRSDDDPYWLGPFQHYNTFCPYLVGSYDRVAQAVAGYINKGYRTFILDIPPSREELEHTSVVFQRAMEFAES